MGDNRDRSSDSRFWGTVPRSMIKGRAFMVYWSFRGQPPPPDARRAERVKELLGVVIHFFTGRAGTGRSSSSTANITTRPRTAAPTPTSFSHERGRRTGH